MWPTKGTKMHEILETINTLTPECHEGRVPVTEIYNTLKESGRESVRVMLSQLKRNGLIEAPMRGMYTLTKKGKKIVTNTGED